jgi:hypothetical protein
MSWLTLTPEQRDQQATFVAFGSCGHVVACAVDTPEMTEENGRDVGRWIKAGLRIEKMKAIDVRAQKFCDCKRKPK